MKYLIILGFIGLNLLADSQEMVSFEKVSDLGQAQPQEESGLKDKPPQESKAQADEKFPSEIKPKPIENFLKKETLEDGWNDDDQSPTSSFEQVTFTFQKVIEIAADYAFTQKMSFITKENATLQRNSAFASMLPTLSVGGAYQKADPSVNTAVRSCVSPAEGCTPLIEKTGNISLNQPITGILTGFQNFRMQLKQVKIDDENYKLQLRTAQFNGALSYINLIKAFQKLEIQKANYKLAKLQEEDAVSQLKVGVIAKSDYLNIALALSQAILTRDQSQMDFEIARVTFLETLGLPRNEVIILPKKYTSLWETKELPQLQPQDVPSLVLNREDVKGAILSKALSQESATLSILNYLPNFNFFMTYSRLFNAQGVQDGSTYYSANDIRNSLIYGVSVNWTFWDWWISPNKISQAYNQARIASLQEDLTKQQARIDLSNNYLNLKSAHETLTTSKVSIKTALEAYRVIREKFKVGLANSLDLVSALSNLTNARSTLVNSRASLDASFFALQRSEGQDLLEVLRKEEN
jgi:outer membrane protein